MDPNIIVLAGPNGAGKSTAAPDLLHGALHVDEFVNAGVIAGPLRVQPGRRGAGRWSSHAFSPEGTRPPAEKHRLRDDARQPDLRAVDSGMDKEGYRFHLFHFWLPSPEMCVNRVRERKSLGGHFVPSETIHRRYHGGIRNFFKLYSPIADRWKFFDNTVKPRVLIASEEGIVNAEVWDKLEQEYHHG